MLFFFLLFQFHLCCIHCGVCSLRLDCEHIYKHAYIHTSFGMSYIFIVCTFKATCFFFWTATYTIWSICLVSYIIFIKNTFLHPPIQNCANNGKIYIQTSIVGGQVIIDIIIFVYLCLPIFTKIHSKITIWIKIFKLFCLKDISVEWEPFLRGVLSRLHLTFKNPVYALCPRNVCFALCVFARNLRKWCLFSF